MDVRHLECFRSVIVTGTMTRAASILGISQPAVSNIIAGLERELGFPLFRRHKGRLLPTPEAKHFYGEVERTLSSFDRTLATARDIRSNATGSLVIACYPGIALDFLPLVVAEFLRERPNVRFKLHSRSSHVIHELIPTQMFDLGIADYPVDHAGVRVEPLTFECMCVLPKGHALTAKKMVTPKDLDGAPFIALFREHTIYHRLERAFQESGAEWNVAVETRFFATACALVAQGAGVTVVDPITAATFARQGLVLRRFQPKVLYEIGLLYPEDRLPSQLLERFVKLVKARLRPYLSVRVP